MKAYGAILSARFRLLLQYRVAALAGLGTQVFWGFIRVMIFGAFYAAAGDAPQPLRFAQVVTYIWLGQAMLRMLPSWNDGELQAMIRSGNVAYELVRPVDVYNLWYARAVALQTAPTLLRSVPMLAMALLLFGMQLPASTLAGVAWALCTLGAVLLSASIVTLMNITLLWTLVGDGVQTLVGFASWLLSGMVIPLPLFPPKVQAVLEALPFRYIIDVPFRLYVGDIPPSQAGVLFVQQLAWTAALALIGRWILARGLRRVVVQGG
jgi:ABC-2 type transport system permease protein